MSRVKTPPPGGVFHFVREGTGAADAVWGLRVPSVGGRVAPPCGVRHRGVPGVRRGGCGGRGSEWSSRASLADGEPGRSGGQGRREEAPRGERLEGRAPGALHSEAGVFRYPLAARGRASAGVAEGEAGAGGTRPYRGDLLAWRRLSMTISVDARREPSGRCRRGFRERTPDPEWALVADREVVGRRERSAKEGPTPRSVGVRLSWDTGGGSDAFRGERRDGAGGDDRRWGRL